MNRTGLIAALFVLLILILAIVAHGQTCGPYGCSSTVSGWRAVATDSCVVPVFIRNDPHPCAGIYVGTIGGRGVTLTCLHAAEYGVTRVADAQPEEIRTDKFGYDMVAVFHRPLRRPAVVIATDVQQGESITVVGYPGGRLLRKVGRIIGWLAPGRHPWGDMRTTVICSNGDSGGAILNSRGQLVGMVWGTSTSDSAAISHLAVSDFICRLRVQFEQPAESPSDPAPDEISDPPEEEPLPPIPVPDTRPTGWDELWELIEANAALIAANAAAIRELSERAAVPGPVGPQGEAGSPGPPGLQGNPGPAGPPFDPAGLTDEQIKAIVARLPPIRMVTVMADPQEATQIQQQISTAKPGDVIQEAVGYLGGDPLKLRFNVRAVKTVKGGGQ